MKSLLIFALFASSFFSIQSHAGACVVSIKCSPYYDEFSGTGYDQDEVDSYNNTEAGKRLRLVYKDSKGRHSQNSVYAYTVASIGIDMSELIKDKKNNALRSARECENELERIEDRWGYCNE